MYKGEHMCCSLYRLNIITNKNKNRRKINKILVKPLEKKTDDSGHDTGKNHTFLTYKRSTTKLTRQFFSRFS